MHQERNPFTHAQTPEESYFQSTLVSLELLSLIYFFNSCSVCVIHFLLTNSNCRHTEMATLTIKHIASLGFSQQNWCIRIGLCECSFCLSDSKSLTGVLGLIPDSSFSPMNTLMRQQVMDQVRFLPPTLRPGLSSWSWSGFLAAGSPSWAGSGPLHLSKIKVPWWLYIRYA